MGIKGRRKRQRAREQRASAGVAHCDPDGESDTDEVPKMKKSELYKMLDEDYLERLHDEHVQRRQSHMLRRKRDRVEDVRTVASELLQEQAQLVGGEDDTGGCTTCAQHNNATTADVAAAARQGRHATAAATAGPFDDPLLGLHPAVVGALDAEGFTRMTLIQERCIPYLLEGCDVLGQARTGSGKTLAFCIPILHRLQTTALPGTSVTQALLMAPTKELCVQTHDVLQRLVAHLPRPGDVVVRVITGGTKVSEERRWLTTGTTIVVGTPGRVHDHAVHCAAWQLSCVQWLVLDEADRMLAEGFKRDLDAILSRLPPKRQTCLFSATNSRSVHELARLSLSRTPLFVSTTGDRPALLPQTENAVQMAPYRHFTAALGENVSAVRQDDGAEEMADAGGEAQQPIPSTLHQFCHIFPLEDRLLQLYVFVKRIARRSKAMVFCSTVASTTFHFQMMGSVGFHDDVMMLHGHMKHRQRVQAFRIFREWETGVLFCTDVAARGLDIPHVDWILQYDPPLDPTEYIHRIGRTARAGNVGSALLFLAPEEAGFVPYLHKYGICLTQYPAAPKTLPAIQEKLEHVLQLDPIVAKSAVIAYRAHVGAYQSHILKETFDVHRLDLARLAHAFALSAAPHVTLPKNSAEEKKREYVKGRLKSLNRRRADALRHYEAMKTKRQWDGGVFVGVAKPSV